MAIGPVFADLFQEGHFLLRRQPPFSRAGKVQTSPKKMRPHQSKFVDLDETSPTITICVRRSTRNHGKFHERRNAMLSNTEVNLIYTWHSRFNFFLCSLVPSQASPPWPWTRKRLAEEDVTTLLLLGGQLLILHVAALSKTMRKARRNKTRDKTRTTRRTMRLFSLEVVQLMPLLLPPLPLRERLLLVMVVPWRARRR